MLHDDGARCQLSATTHVLDFEGDEVTAAKLAKPRLHRASSCPFTKWRYSGPRLGLLGRSIHYQFCSMCMPISPIIVYLDNQDYSKLADTRLHAKEPDLPHLLSELRDLEHSGKVVFAFSGVSVAEAFPDKPSDIKLAQARVELLKELCEDHALPSYGLLARREVERLHRRRDDGRPVFSDASAWLPQDLVSELAGSFQNASATQQAAAAMKMKGMNPDRDRRMHSMLTSAIRVQLRQQRQLKIDAGDFYTIKPEFHETLLNLACGDATAADRSAALLGSWCDPTWVLSLHDRIPDLPNWLRNGMRKPHESAAAALKRFVSTMHGSAVLQSWKHGGWDKVIDDQILDLVPSIAEVYGIDLEDFGRGDVTLHCPGLTVERSTFMYLAWSYIAGGNQTEIEPNSPGDAMHAAYAPYVDVFRTDSAMAPHVKKALARTTSTTKVVSDRRQLVSQIRTLI